MRGLAAALAAIIGVSSAAHAQSVRDTLQVSVRVQPSVVITASAAAIEVRSASGAARVTPDRPAPPGAPRVTSVRDGDRLRMQIDF